MVAFLAPLFATAASTSATIGAAASLAGSAISASNNSRNNRRNIAAQDRLNWQNIAESRRADALNHKRTLQAEKRNRRRAIADRDEHRRYNDPAAARARAEAAGFHPLAVADQSGAFVTAPTNIAPAPAVVPRLGRAVTQAYTGWGESFSRIASLQMQKSQLELDNKRLEMQYKRQIQSPPKGGIYSQSTRGSSSKVDSENDPKNPFKINQDDYNAFGLTLTPDPKISDAERIEERGGDLLQSLHGIAVFAKDFVHTYDPFGARARIKENIRTEINRRRIERNLIRYRRAKPVQNAPRGLPSYLNFKDGLQQF